jgi:hypothetical protein
MLKIAEDYETLARRPEFVSVAGWTSIVFRDSRRRLVGPRCAVAAIGPVVSVAVIDGIAARLRT